MPLAGDFSSPSLWVSWLSLLLPGVWEVLWSRRWGCPPVVHQLSAGTLSGGELKRIGSRVPKAAGGPCPWEGPGPHGGGHALCSGPGACLEGGCARIHLAQGLSLATPFMSPGVPPGVRRADEGGRGPEDDWDTAAWPQLWAPCLAT